MPASIADADAKIAAPPHEAPRVPSRARTRSLSRAGIALGDVHVMTDALDIGVSVTFQSIPFRSTLPDVDVLEARMFRLAGRDFGKKLSAFAKLDAEEAPEELSTLTAAITRAIYPSAVAS